jgi:hypothetical protein
MLALGASAGYVSLAVGRRQQCVARLHPSRARELSLDDALWQIEALVAARVPAATSEERAAVIQRPKRSERYARHCAAFWSTAGSTCASYRARPGGPDLG